MNDNEDTIVVFTARGPKGIISEGGSGAWRLDSARARLCTWLVCTQNRRNANREFADATEPHGCGFLLGKISGVHPSPEGGRRWLIAISEFVPINYPNLWDHKRFPVRYTSLSKLGISIEGLRFQPIPARIDQLIESSRKILDLEEDWDGEGASPIKESTWQRAADFLRRTALTLLSKHSLRLENPSIVPASDGSIDLHRKLPTRELLINIPPNQNECADYYGDNTRGGNIVKGSLNNEAHNDWLFVWLEE